MRYRFLLTRAAISCLIRSSSSGLFGEIACKDPIILSKLHGADGQKICSSSQAVPNGEQEGELSLVPFDLAVRPPAMGKKKQPINQSCAMTRPGGGFTYLGMPFFLHIFFSTVAQTCTQRIGS